MMLQQSVEQTIFNQQEDNQHLSQGPPLVDKVSLHKISGEN